MTIFSVWSRSRPRLFGLEPTQFGQLRDFGLPKELKKVEVPQLFSKSTSAIFKIHICYFQNPHLAQTSHLEVDGVASLNVGHPGGEQRGRHPGIAVLTAGYGGLPVATLARHPHLEIHNKINQYKNRNNIIKRGT